jgi:hypothetical protein
MPPAVHRQDWSKNGVQLMLGEKMRMIPGLLLALVLASGCTTIPAPTKSAFFYTYTGGLRYNNGDPNSAAAFLSLKPEPEAPDFMYVEVVLLDPSQSNGQEVLRREIKKADGVAEFEGTRRSGWTTNTTYKFIAKVYSDSSCKILLGVHEQLVLSPSESVLQRIKELPPIKAEPSGSANTASPGQ